MHVRTSCFSWPRFSRHVQDAYVLHVTTHHHSFSTHHSRGHLHMLVRSSDTSVHVPVGISLNVHKTKKHTTKLQAATIPALTMPQLVEICLSGVARRLYFPQLASPSYPTWLACTSKRSLPCPAWGPCLSVATVPPTCRPKRVRQEEARKRKSWL